MTIAPGLFSGFEEAGTTQMAGWESGNAAINTTASNQHLDGSGDLHGLQSLSHGNGGNALFRIRRTDIPWEDVVMEIWWKPTNSGTGDLRFKSGSTDTVEIHRNSGGTLAHYVNNVLKSTTTKLELQDGIPKMVSSHVYYHATLGFVTTWIDGQLALDDQSQNTEAGATSSDGFQSYWAGLGAGYTDDLGYRPRTILIDGVTSADSATPSGTITGGTSSETGVIYAWENDSDDSASAGGDSTLAAGEWRLYIKNLSFGPDATTGGFQNNETITGHGLTGTVLCNAPAANYMHGLEPGGMFYYQRLHILKMAVSGVGTENIDGTLQGGPTDRADALDTGGDGLEVRHTAAAESVTVAVTGLTAAQEAVIDSVIGAVVTVRGLTDGGVPNSLIPRILDNGGSAQNGRAGVVGASNTTVQNFFPLNGSAGLWVLGTGAAGIDSSEPGYETK